jgi:hypothetical protein
MIACAAHPFSRPTLAGASSGDVSMSMNAARGVNAPR